MDVPERHLAAILSADAVGYSRLMAADEAGTIRAITACRELIGRLVSGHRGRVVDSPGDNILAEFRTALDAVTCAVEIQGALHATNADLPKERRMVFRIGVHLGDIASEGANIYGTGVNVAARLEALADPGGICISSEVYGQVQSKLALGYDDLGEQSVKNIPTPVRVYAVRLDKKADRQPRAAAARWGKLRIVAVTAVGALLAVAAVLWLSWPAPIGLVLDLAGVGSLPENPPLPDKPSLVVLPFDNLSGDPEQDYFADGLVEDLTTDLSRNPFLFVIARNSAFTYKGKAVRVEDVGRELGVRYVVEGSVRRIENRVRINAQLNRELADIFAVQTEIVSALLDSVGVEVMVSERNRARRKTKNLNAYDAMWKGIHYLSFLSRAGNAEARRWAEQAIALDSGYADAHAIVAALTPQPRSALRNSHAVASSWIPSWHNAGRRRRESNSSTETLRRPSGKRRRPSSWPQGSSLDT
jgi:adenylate cyclase